MLKTIIDSLRSYRDQIDAEIDRLENLAGTETTVFERPKRKYTRRLGVATKLTTTHHTQTPAARRANSIRMKKMWAARRAKGFTKLG